MKSQRVATVNTALKVAIAQSATTQTVIGRRARIEKTRFSKILHRRGIPTPKEMKRIARVLHSTPEALFSEATV